MISRILRTSNFLPVLLSLLPILFLSPINAAETVTQATAKGPHGGTIVKDESNQYEVKIDRASRHVDVFTLNQQNTPPKSMELTLFRDEGTGQTVSLRAVNINDPLPKFQGEIKSFAGSYVGAELRFEVSLKSLKILKFVPYFSTP